MWFQQLFGDTSVFAMRVELDVDPHPPAGLDPTLLASWGRLTIWVRGRCLTQSVLHGSSLADGVEWYLLPFLRWAWRCAPALVNEEPFPKPVRKDNVASATDWLLASEDFPLTPRENEEYEYFRVRSDWRCRHALRAAFDGAVVPNILFRRLDDFVEVSWDNESWPSLRSDLRFTEPEGAAQVPAEAFGAVWRALCATVAQTLERRCGTVPDFSEFLAIAPGGPTAVTDTWRYLLPAHIGQLLECNKRFSSVLNELRQNADNASRSGSLVVKHTVSSLLLRDSLTAAPAEVEKLLELSRGSNIAGAWSPLLCELQSPRPAPWRRPWDAGYEAALTFREEVGWESDPAPRLSDWLSTQQVTVVSRDLPTTIAGVTVAPVRHRPLICGNGNAQASTWSGQMATAAGLGHLLLDAAPDRDFAIVHSDRAHWPTVARARAFAAMLLMPEDGVREVVAEQSADQSADQSAGLVSGLRRTINAVMDRFGVGLQAAAYHMLNLGLISRDEIFEIGVPRDH